jgi:hypothetical protein
MHHEFRNYIEESDVRIDGRARGTKAATQGFGSMRVLGEEKDEGTETEDESSDDAEEGAEESGDQKKEEGVAIPETLTRQEAIGALKAYCENRKGAAETIFTRSCYWGDAEELESHPASSSTVWKVSESHVTQMCVDCTSSATPAPETCFPLEVTETTGLATWHPLGEYDYADGWRHAFMGGAPGNLPDICQFLAPDGHFCIVEEIVEQR